MISSLLSERALSPQTVMCTLSLRHTSKVPGVGGQNKLNKSIFYMWWRSSQPLSVLFRFQSRWPASLKLKALLSSAKRAPVLFSSSARGTNQIWTFLKSCTEESTNSLHKNKVDPGKGLILYYCVVISGGIDWRLVSAVKLANDNCSKKKMKATDMLNESSESHFWNPQGTL